MTPAKRGRQHGLPEDRQAEPTTVARKETITSSYNAVIVKGRFALRSRENGETRTSEVYGPGSHVYKPGGEVHSEANASDTDDLYVLVHLDGPLDAVLAERPS